MYIYKMTDEFTPQTLMGTQPLMLMTKKRVPFLLKVDGPIYYARTIKWLVELYTICI